MSFKVEVIQEGGFAGIRRSIVLDANSLPAHEVDTLQSLIDEARFFTLPISLMTTQGADRLIYSITVEKSGQRHTVRTNQVETQPALQNLIAYVKTKTKGR
jgi:hypothetical protein